MECALVPNLPEGPDWTYEVKLDGYRAIGVKGRETILHSRNGKNFNKRFPQIVEALGKLPADTVIDGEVVALDGSGRPDFHRLQHFTAEASRIRYFVFDLLIWEGRDLTNLPLSERRDFMRLIKLSSPRIRLSEQFNAPAPRSIMSLSISCPFSAQPLPLNHFSRWLCTWLLKPLREIRQLHLMLNSDVRDGNLNDALLKSVNPIAAPQCR
jgi:hypothetical protein